MNYGAYGSDRADVSTINSTTTNQCETDVEDRAKFKDWARRLSLSEDDLAVFCRHGFHYEKVPPKNTAHRRTMLAYLKRAGTAPARWMLVSGMFSETSYSEPERRKRLRALYQVTILLIKRSLAYQAAEQIAERSIYWDPIAEVCRELQIAPSKLSSFCKELSGHSLSQLIDCVRAERIKKLMKVKIRKFVREFRTHRATLGADAAGEIDWWDVWKALKTARKWPEFCLNSWAIEMGFASYRRLYRACLAVWKETPHQMEMGMIVECIGEGEAGDTVEEIGEEEMGLVEIQGLIDGVRNYADEG